MSQNKTQANTANVAEFLAQIADPQKRADCEQIKQWMQELSGEPPMMWGSAMIGFGQYHYRYDSGREGDFFRTGFSPRAQNITLYIMAGFSQYDDLLAKLGKHKTGKSCLYIKRLSDIDAAVLRELIQASLDWMAEKYPE